MSLEDDLYDALHDAYQRAGREANYWGNYFLRSLRTNGSVPAARRILAKRGSAAFTKGFRAIADAGRADLSVEAVILQPRFHSLFTPVELQIARERLRKFPHWQGRRSVAIDDLFPEQVEAGIAYREGATRPKISAFAARLSA